MRKYLQIINIRTFQVLFICLATSFLAIYFQIDYNFDFTIISIAIIFPLVFTIRAAFRRREKALEHLSRFKSGLTIVHRCLQRGKKLSDEKKAQARELILQLSEALIAFLTAGNGDQTALRASVNEVYKFIQDNKPEMPTSEAFKVLRFMKDAQTAIENTVAIYEHRTPISLRAYCQVFINFFPLIYTPALLNRLHEGSPDWVVYMLSAVTGFILISLYNVQDQMENPFDQHGLDDIQVKMFKLEI